MRKISYKLAAGFMAAALAFTGVPFVSGLFDTGTVLAAENSDADTQKTYSFGYGESETNLTPGVYTVPVKMINLSNVTNAGQTYDSFLRSQYSMAWQCIANDGNVQVKVYQDGTASVTMDLQSVTYTLGENTLTDMAMDWTVYQDFDTYLHTSSKGDAFVKEWTKAARVDETTHFVFENNNTGVPKEKDAPTQITYKVPNTDRNAVLVRMWIDAMNISQDAAFYFDWKDAVKEEGVQTENTAILDASDLQQDKTYLVPASLKKSTDISSDSAAAAAIAKYVELTVDEDEKYQLTADLSSVSMAGLVDWCQDIQYYDGTFPLNDNAKWKDVTVQAEKEVDQSLGEETKTVPTRISFPMPEAMQKELEESGNVSGGVYIKMYVEAMNYSPSAYIQLDFANAKEKGDPTMTYQVTGSSRVNLFGKYDVNASVSVEDGKISGVTVEGSDFGGTHAGYNQMKLATAAEGMSENLKGKYDTDQAGIYSVDTVSGATVSSEAIRNAVLTALDLEVPVEEIPEAPESVEAGTYTIEISNITDVVSHSLIENDRADAVLLVDENGTMELQYQMISSTEKEPLQVLGMNGYYKNNDRTSKSNLTTEGAVYQYEKENTYNWDVVTDVRIPLAGELASQYYTNVYLYVEAMKNLGAEKPEEISGVLFDKGYFNIDSTITLYWNTLEKVDSSSVDKSELEELHDFAMTVIGNASGKYTDADKTAAEEAREMAAEIILSSDATVAQVSAAVTNVRNLLADLLPTDNGGTETPPQNQNTGQNQNVSQNQNTSRNPNNGAGTQTAALQTGNTYTVGGNTYQATSAEAVTVKTVANKKSVKIPATVTINGVKAKVTAIGNNAFKKAKKKLTKVTIGANVTSIGKKAFAGCRKLKKVTVKSKKLTKVGKKAFQGINKKAVIKVPKKCRKAYTKLFKNKGQARTVMIR